MNKRFSLVLSGTVQGVGFRYFAVMEAEKLKIKGYVKNLNFGRLEIVAEGEETSLAEFKSRMIEGPSNASISNYQIEDDPFQDEFKIFEIRY